MQKGSFFLNAVYILNRIGLRMAKLIVKDIISGSAKQTTYRLALLVKV